MSLGSTLREARERKGLTIVQVAEQTRMIHQLVEEIEQDDFHRISAPIYGRGFIKLFAECVDEDPAPLMQEFTEIYTGLRRPGVRTRPVQTPVERPEVAEPKDRNAPPPRPKVRAVVVADDDAAPVEPVESPKSKVSSPADAGRDAPVASAAPTVPTSGVLPKEVASPAEAGTPVASAAPTAPTGGALPKEVSSPADAGTPVASAAPTVPTSGVLPKEVASLAEAGTPVASAAPTAPTSGTLPKEVSSPADAGSDAPVASTAPTAPTSGALPNDSTTDEPKDDESLLGELFDLVVRKRAQHSEGSSSEKLQVKEESHVKISLPQPAPSWDDAPLEEEGDFWQKLYNLDRWKYWKVGAALAGLCLLAVIVFGVVIKLHSKPETAADAPSVSQTTTTSEPESEAASSTPAPTPTPTPAPTPTPDSNSQLSTPSVEAAEAAPADGKTVYTANLIPPPDSYVD